MPAYLVGSAYGYDPSLAAWVANNPSVQSNIAAGLITSVTGYDGLYVQGGGNVTVTAGGNFSDVYTYVQNGTTSLQAGLAATGLALETSTGNVSVQANRGISIADKLVNPSVTQRRLRPRSRFRASRSSRMPAFWSVSNLRRQLLVS
jgi:hypothetical protein